MGKDDALYPSYAGNPQTNLADYPDVPSETGVAHASDYNKLDNEILKHQEVLSVTIPVTYMPFSGGVFTDFITLSAAPTVDLHAATKKYVDDSISVENLWDRTVATSTLAPHTANDNVNIGTGAGTFRAVHVEDLTMEGSSILAGAGSSGVLTLGGTGGTNNENLTLDFETTGRVLIGGTATRFKSSVQMNDVIPIYFGLNFDALIRWSSIGKDSLQIGTKVGNDEYSGYVSLMEVADIGNANRFPASTSANPVLRVYSSDANEANDYIEMYHNQVDAVIANGNGTMLFDSASWIVLDPANGYVQFKANNVATFYIIANTWNDELLLGTVDATGNQLVLSNNANIYADHDHAVQTDPTLFIHSDFNPDTSNNQWGSLHHDQSDFLIQTGVMTGAGSSPTVCTNRLKIDATGGTQVLANSNLLAEFLETGTKIQPNAGGDVVLFGDTDVDNADRGKALIIHRKAAEGDHTFTMDTDTAGNAVFVASRNLTFSSNSDIDFYNNTTLRNNTTLGISWGTANRWMKQYGYITAASAQKYIQHQISDTTDKYEITFQDDNILGMTIDGSTFAIDTVNNRVGIGTADPAETLHVAGDVMIGDDVGINISGKGIAGGNALANWTAYFGQDATHNTGFGWKYNASVAAAYGRLFTFGYSNPLHIDASKIVLQSQVASYNVGIGTTAPATKLHVHGNITMKSGSGIRPDYNGVDALNLQDAAGSNILTVDTINSRVQIGDGTNYAQFASDGELTLAGTARATKCLVFDNDDLTVGSVGPDGVILGNYRGLSYDIGDDSVFTFYLPNDWASGTDLTIACRWYINEAYASDKEIKWRVAWSAVPVDESEAVDAPTHSGTGDSADTNIPATAKYLTQTTIGTISGASLSVNDEVGVTFSRIALTDGDNPTADPVVTCIGVIYTVDKLGTAL